jgi:hypothetical protein
MSSGPLLPGSNQKIEDEHDWEEERRSPLEGEAPPEPGFPGLPCPATSPQVLARSDRNAERFVRPLLPESIKKIEDEHDWKKERRSPLVR